MRAVRICLLLAALLLCASITGAQEPSAQIKAEIERLQQSLKEKPITAADFVAVNDMAKEALRAAADALNSGHLYLSLEKLAQAINLLHGGRMAEEKSAAVQSGLPAFEAEWNKVSLQLTALERDAQARDWKNTPLAVRALAEAAQGRSIPLLDGGRGFAASTKPHDGLFYVGQAEGEAAFAKFCASLQIHQERGPIPLRSFLPELHNLQQKTNAAFKPPKSIDQHSRFIALNSALKLAEELDARKSYAGSLYQYLEATRQFGMLDAQVPDANQQSTSKNAVAAAHKKLVASALDESIAGLFLERAASYVAHPDGSAPTSDEWKGAQIILDHVLPAYSAAQKAAAPIDGPKGKKITLTLVRWPYT